MAENTPKHSAETFQEGVTPVQAFVVTVIPPSQGAPPEERRGRPVRPIQNPPQGPAAPPEQDPTST